MPRMVSMAWSIERTGGNSLGNPSGNTSEYLFISYLTSVGCDPSAFGSAMVACTVNNSASAETAANCCRDINTELHWLVILAVLALTLIVLLPYLNVMVLLRQSTSGLA